ncbi:MAG: FMN-binding protein [Hungatella sp.]
MRSVDAVSGATISSKAVVTAINNSYYFLAESGIR